VLGFTAAIDIMGDEVVFSDGVGSSVSAVQVKGLDTDVPAVGLGVCDSRGSLSMFAVRIWLQWLSLTTSGGTLSGRGITVECGLRPSVTGVG